MKVDFLKLQQIELVEKKKFFNLGKENNWKELIDLGTKKEIEKSFEKEMKELGYL